MSYAEERKNKKYYKFINSILSIVSIGKDSIVDVGSHGVDILTNTECRYKVSVDIAAPAISPGVQSVKEDFFKYTPDRFFDLVTCFQVLEHIKDAKTFAQKLLSIGQIIIISVPYNWKKGMCKSHCQDPVDIKKLVSWFNKNPVFVQCVNARLVAIFLHSDKDISLNKINQGNFADIFNCTFDIGAQQKKDNYLNLLYEEYKKLRMHYDDNLKKFTHLSPSEMLTNCLKKSDECEEYFIAGLELYPFVLDKYNRPVFLKEYIRYLLNKGRFSTAIKILQSDMPSTRMMSTEWSKMLFARAYEEYGMLDKSLEMFSQIGTSREVDDAIKRIKKKSAYKK